MLSDSKHDILSPDVKIAHELYNHLDQIFRLMMGDTPSISNSWPGSYGEPNKKNVEKAQQKKYEEYFNRLGLKENQDMKILEIGPGWGPFSNYCRNKGIHVVSVCPADNQYKYLKKLGFDVHQGVWQTFTPTDKNFDAIVIMGSGEHFASPSDFLNGNQEKVYSDFFNYAHKFLKPNGRIGGQFMTFNGKKIDYTKLTVKEEGKDNESQMNYHIGLLEHFYPEAFLPRDFEHFYSCCDNKFKVLSVVDGREHYVWTMRCWRNEFKRIFPLRKWLIFTRFFIRSLVDEHFGYAFKSFWVRSNSKCFEEGWMGHEFFFMEKNND